MIGRCEEKSVEGYLGIPHESMPVATDDKTLRRATITSATCRCLGQPPSSHRVTPDVQSR